MEKKKMSYVQPQTETIMVQMEHCIASPQNSLSDMGGNSIYDESF